VRSYMGSPPYVKGLRNPVKANTSPAQEYSQAPAQPSAEEGPDMPDKEGAVPDSSNTIVIQAKKPSCHTTAAPAA